MWPLNQLLCVLRSGPVEMKRAGLVEFYFSQPSGIKWVSGFVLTPVCCKHRMSKIGVGHEKQHPLAFIGLCEEQVFCSSHLNSFWWHILTLVVFTILHDAFLPFVPEHSDTVFAHNERQLCINCVRSFLKSRWSHCVLSITWNFFETKRIQR